MVGFNGTIYKTTDNGVNWQNMPSVTNESLVSVCFPATDTGYAISNYGSIIKTINGGLSWTIQSLGFSLNSVFFTDVNTGYIVGNGGKILKTTDGGLSWNALISGTSSNLHSVNFTDNNTGYIVGWHGLILTTSNGGLTWNPSPYMTNNNLNFVYFTNSNTAYIVGDNGTILKTTNGGGLGIPETTLTKNLKVYPNPATNSLTLNLSQMQQQQNASLSIYDIQGKQLLQQNISEAQTQINISNFAKGIYIVKLQTDKETLQSKFVKE
jgi:hypothetical protein